MHLENVMLLCCLFALPLAVVPRPRAEEDLRVKFEALDEKGDHTAIVRLWRDHPAEALGVIDSYLEGSLSKLEADRATPPATIAAMEARALRGARAADEAFGTAIFADYASSFGSWNGEEQTRFRRGQELFGVASKALRAKNYADALAKATESLDLARPLGDWWGSAMALGVMGQAHLQLGHKPEALDCASQAHLIDHDLRLLQAEYTTLDVIVRSATELGRVERALVAAEAGLALARQLGEETGAAAFEKAIVDLRARMAK